MKKDAKKHALKFIDTEYGLTIKPCRSSMNNNQKKIETLEKAILRIRQDIIDSSKNFFADEVKKRCTFWCENNLELEVMQLLYKVIPVTSLIGFLRYTMTNGESLCKLHPPYFYPPWSSINPGFLS